MSSGLCCRGVLLTHTAPNNGMHPTRISAVLIREARPWRCPARAGDAERWALRLYKSVGLNAEQQNSKMNRGLNAYVEDAAQQLIEPERE